MQHRGPVEETVRSYFKAYEADGDMAPFVTGRLAELIRWGTAAESNWRFEDRTIDVRKLDVTGINGGSAHAELDAEERVNLVMDDLKGPMTMSYSGPIRLEFVDGAWKIADYTMNGSSLCDEIVCHEESTSSHGLELLPRLSILRPTTVSVLFSVHNLRSSAVWPSEGFVRTRVGRIKAGVLAASPSIGPGEVRTLRVDFGTRASGRLSLIVPSFDLGERKWLHSRASFVLPRRRVP